jgi:DNA (cytosine-5)-methyltransferase 1
MGTGGHNVPLIVTDLGFRKLTPRECFNFQGFPKSFILPKELADSHLYKQAGNAVTVKLISLLANQIKMVLHGENPK